ncbi:MAG: YncE family protein, partial [Bacteroidales bacterium]
MNKKTTYILLIILLALSSCMKDDELWYRDKQNISGSSQGLFIVNEGNFMYNNASLSYYDTESREVYNDIFFNTNGLALGDVASSMTIIDSLAWIVLNNSGKINIMNTSTFEYAGKVTGLTSPRHIHFISDSKAYVSDLYAQAVTIIDPRSREISGYIDVSNNASPYGQHPTEQMVSY